MAESYRCTRCGKTDVKLWRVYLSFSDSLYCVHCAFEHEDIEVPPDVETIRPETLIVIGWLVAAIPNLGRGKFWGYEEVPQADLNWWYQLPNGRSAVSTNLLQLKSRSRSRKFL